MSVAHILSAIGIKLVNTDFLAHVSEFGLSYGTNEEYMFR